MDCHLDLLENDLDCVIKASCPGLVDDMTLGNPVFGRCCWGCTAVLTYQGSLYGSQEHWRKLSLKATGSSWKILIMHLLMWWAWASITKLTVLYLKFSVFSYFKVWEHWPPLILYWNSIFFKKSAFKIASSMVLNCKGTLWRLLWIGWLSFFLVCVFLKISLLLSLMENKKLMIPGREECIDADLGFQFFATRR